ncbi:MAG: zinc finger domain-containing protein [Candidatus Thermoplasmatota archaeon]
MRMTGDTMCNSCGIRLTMKHSTVFKCPNCHESVIGRCAQCRDQSVQYECEQCGFKGP